MIEQPWKSEDLLTRLSWWAFKFCGKGEREDMASDTMSEAEARIEKLEAALSHIWAWYPINVSKPHETIDAIKDYAFAAIKGEKKND